MFNFENEINIIRNPKINYFIASDYFHDSIVHSLTFSNENDLQITVFCNREWETNKNTSQFDDIYKYQLIFKKVIYFNSEIKNNLNIYLNGRFKNSFLYKKNNKKYFHFRIQLLSGYIDILFKSFDITKCIGNINLPKKVSSTKAFGFALSRMGKLTSQEIKEILDAKDDFYIVLMLQKLFILNKTSIIKTILNQLVLKIDQETGKDLIVTIIFIIGELKLHKYSKYLDSLLANENNILFIKHIKDAQIKLLNTK